MTGKRGKVARIVALILAAVMIIFSLPLIAMSSDAAGASGAEIAGQHRLGSWWWWPEDGFNDASAAKYLSLCQEAGVNEIYFYAYHYLTTAANREKVHTFVQKAMSYGCRVAIMYDGWADLKDGDTSYLTDTLKTNFLAYKEEYPKDAVYGMHFDLEPSGGYMSQDFVDYFIAPLQELRDAGIWCEVDVSVNWQKRGGATVEYDGVKGINNILACYTDTMSLMSYRTSVRNVLSCADACLESAKIYGCPILYGLETGDSGEGSDIDFMKSTREKLFEVIDGVFEELDGMDLEIPYGMAIHHNRAFYNLPGTIPERTTHAAINENTTATEYSRVTQQSTEAPTTTEVQGLQETVLYSEKFDDYDVELNDRGTVYKVPELSEALVADYETNGPIDPTQGEYYQVTAAGTTMFTDNVYPCLMDTRFVDHWADKADYPNGTQVTNFFIGVPPTVIANIRKSIDFTRNGTESDPDKGSNCLYFVGDSSRNLFLLKNITVKVFRNPNKVITTATEAEPTETATATATLTEAEPTETATATLTEAEPTATATVTEAKPTKTAAPTKAEPTVIPTAQTTADEDFLLGDPNDDGVINMKDVLTLRKYMASIEVYINLKAADVTADGVVNMKDILQLRKFVAGLIETL